MLQRMGPENRGQILRMGTDQSLSNTNDLKLSGEGVGTLNAPPATQTLPGGSMTSAFTF